MPGRGGKAAKGRQPRRADSYRWRAAGTGAAQTAPWGRRAGRRPSGSPGEALCERPEGAPGPACLPARSAAAVAMLAPSTMRGGSRTMRHTETFGPARRGLRSPWSRRPRCRRHGRAGGERDGHKSRGAPGRHGRLGLHQGPRWQRQGEGAERRRHRLQRPRRATASRGAAVTTRSPAGAAPIATGCSGGLGEDKIRGNSGDDEINGGSTGATRCTATRARTMIEGWLGSDFIAGNAGDDAISGGDVSGDRIYAGPGNDSVGRRRRKGPAARRGRQRPDSRATTTTT